MRTVYKVMFCWALLAIPLDAYWGWWGWAVANLLAADILARDLGWGPYA